MSGDDSLENNLQENETTEGELQCWYKLFTNQRVGIRSDTKLAGNLKNCIQFS